MYNDVFGFLKIEKFGQGLLDKISFQNQNAKKLDNPFDQINEDQKIATKDNKQVWHENESNTMSLEDILEVLHESKDLIKLY